MKLNYFTIQKMQEEIKSFILNAHDYSIYKVTSENFVDKSNSQRNYEKIYIDFHIIKVIIKPKIEEYKGESDYEEFTVSIEGMCYMDECLYNILVYEYLNPNVRLGIKCKLTADEVLEKLKSSTLSGIAAEILKGKKY